MTPTSSARICPICDHNDVEVLITQDFVLPEGHPLDAKQAIVCCSQCGFVFADVGAMQTQYDDYYSRFSKYEDNQTHMGGGTDLDLLRSSTVAAFLDGIVHDKQVRILDVGCANGAMLGELQKIGYMQLCGIDLSTACLDNARRQYGIETHVGSLPNLPADIGDFDLVILSHVLEHVKDIKQALAQVHRLLSPAGQVYIEVPDALRYKDFVFSPFQEFNTEHINHFSAQSLDMLLRRCGFRVSESRMKLIEAAAGMPSPVLMTVAGKTDIPRPTSRITPDKDVDSRQRILAYIATSQLMMDRIAFNLRKILSMHASVLVWGTGQLVLKLLAETALADADIKAFVDSNPANQGRVLHGVPILAPMQITGMGYPIIVTSTLHYDAIARYIREQLRLTNVVFPLEQGD